MEITVIKKGETIPETGIIKGETFYAAGVAYCKMWEIRKWWR